MRIQNTINKINFTAGKINLYSDFDGTYCPAKHSSLHDPNANSFMSDYCNKMDSFFKSTKNDVHFNLTTGRTYGEYESISWLLKMRGFNLPLPETLITKDGSDRLIKTGTDEDFYQNGKFPFDYNKTFKEKETHLKELTNWDGDNIKNELKRIAEKYQIRLVEADSQNSVSDYGERSLYSNGKLNADDWKKLPLKDEKVLEHNTPIADYVLGSRNDGKLKLNIIFPPDYGFCPERTHIYDCIKNDLINYLRENNIKHNIEWEEANKYNHRRISCSITPEFENGALTKLYDTKEAVKKAIQNNDIVITAGDGSNDLDMLNPLKHLDSKFIETCKNNSTHREFYTKNDIEKLEDLQKVLNGNSDDYINGLRKELTENGFLKQLKEIPMYSIVIKNKNSKLKKLIEAFEKLGKVVAVDTGKIDEGIKAIIKKHALNNETFKNAMSENLHKFIFNITKNNSIESLNNSKNGLGLLLTGCAGLGGAIGIKYSKNSKDLQNENNATTRISNINFSKENN